MKYNSSWMLILSAVVLISFSPIIYCEQDLNVKVSKGDQAGELILEWNEVQEATAYFVRMFDTKNIPNYIVNILKRGKGFEEGELRMIQSLTDKAEIFLTDKNKIKIRNLKYRDYFFIVSASKPFMGKYYLKWIASSEIVSRKPGLDILSIFKKDKEIISEPNLIVNVKISDLVKDIKSYCGKVIKIEGQYVYSENIPVVLSDIMNYFFITDGMWKIGCSQRIGLPTHPETYKYQQDKEVKENYINDEKEFNQKVSGKYKVRAIGSIILVEDLPRHGVKGMKAEETELWTELVFFEKDKFKSSKGLFYAYFAQNLGKIK
ncbi:MAG: hypothetical protein ABH873_10315 [Candidatus Firestonebacteria bacterium]